jgi:hypothetical protein
MQQVISISTKLGDFDFRIEETVRDKYKIRSEVIKLYDRGIEGFAELEELATKELQRNEQYNIQRFGKENFNEIIKELRQPETNDDRKKEITVLLTKENEHFYKYYLLNEELKTLYSYARLKVLCTRKPEDIDFFAMKNESDLQEILDQLEQQKVFFRI